MRKMKMVKMKRMTNLRYMLKKEDEEVEVGGGDEGERIRMEMMSKMTRRSIPRISKTTLK